MTDPYQVLGVSPQADDSEIKSAYRELARKYHPDHYAGNPLADLASEKMKEINEAYDQITTMRKNGAQSGYQASAGSTGTGSSQFADIRRLINARRITEAEELLDGTPPQARDGEWFFLKGTVQYTRGWLDEAFASFTRACQLEPNNQEFRNTYNQLQWQRQNGRPMGHGGGYRTQGGTSLGGCSVCDVCTALYCMDCCCECMGGNLCC